MNSSAEKSSVTISQLQDQIRDIRKKTLDIKIKIAFDEFKDTSSIRKNRREVARLVTKINVLRKELG